MSPNIVLCLCHVSFARYCYLRSFVNNFKDKTFVYWFYAGILKFISTHFSSTRLIAKQHTCRKKMELRPERNIPQFNGDCYGAWKFRIKTVLEELHVYSLIEQAPPENPDAEWTEKNKIAKSTIVNFLGDAFLHYAEGNATAKSIIVNLDKLYAKRNLTAQVALRKQLADLKLLPSLNLTQHFIKFDKLISDLISSGANITEMDKICQLLATLPPSFDGVIGPLEEFYGDNFNLAFVKTHLLDFEAKMEIDTVTTLRDTFTSSPQIINNNQQKTNVQQRNQNLQYRNPSHSTYMHCNFCGRNNHLIQNCHIYNGQNSNFNMRGARRNFPFNFPAVPGPKKVKKQQKKKAFLNNTVNRRLTNPNPYSAPVKTEVKEEPVWVKQEPIEIKQEPGIKQEPAWIKEEPQWYQSEQPIKVEPGTQNGQGSIYLGSTPNRETVDQNKNRTSANLIAMHIRSEVQAPTVQQQPSTSVQYS